MKSSTSINAQSSTGTNPAKTFFYIGIIFVIIGVIIGVGSSILFIAIWAPTLGNNLPMAILFVLLFMALFCGIGGAFAAIGYKQIHAEDQIYKEGTTYYAKIFSYGQDPRILMNGQPCILLNVRYIKNGQIVQSSVNTNSVDISKYPRGATCAIKVHNNQAALIPNSISNKRLEKEDDLMNPDFDATHSVSSLGVDCPNCGANIAIPIGMSRYCPYCNTKITLTIDGYVIG